MASPSPGPSASAFTSASSLPPPVNRHALTPLERQRAQLSKLLKDPAKPVNIPAPPKEKTIRPPREMMKNVQGSSAGAGSGEFHVYKANRRREYERLKLMEEMSKKVCLVFLRPLCKTLNSQLDVYRNRSLQNLKESERSGRRRRNLRPRKTGLNG